MIRIWDIDYAVFSALVCGQYVCILGNATRVAQRQKLNSFRQQLGRAAISNAVLAGGYETLKRSR